jgi:hypothetical protein
MTVARDLGLEFYRMQDLERPDKDRFLNPPAAGKSEALSLEPLRFHLDGDPAVSCALYEHLCTHLQEARVSLPGAAEPARPLR